MNDQIHEIQALDRFLDELIEDPDVPAPIEGELDPQTLMTARRMVAAEQSRAPSAAEESAAQARVWQRVLAADLTPDPFPAEKGSCHTPLLVGEGRGERSATQASLFTYHTTLTKALRTTFAFPIAMRAALVSACLLVAVGVSLYVWASQPPAVSAQEIIDRARATANSPAAGGVQSFVLIETGRMKPLGPYSSAPGELKGDETILEETKLWYEAPNRWRREFQQRIVAPDGKEASRFTSIGVSDGTDMWDYQPANNFVTVNRLDPTMTGKDQFALFAQGAESLNALFQQASTCFDPKVAGSGTIVGRDAYVIDLGPNKCPPASAPELGGRLVIWVDKAAFFVLRKEQHSATDDKVIEAREVSQIQYNIAIDPAQFTFTPPAGSKIMDNRPKPAPTGDQFQQQLQRLAKQVDFPVLAPNYLPAGLAPQQPKINTMMGTVVEISYFPTSEPDKDSLASMQKGLTIEEQRATNSLVARWTENDDPITIAGNKGWLRRGIRNADGTGSNSAALVLRDGVLISISSFTISPEELVKVAASLQPVPGALAPLPNPTPLTLAELRRRVAFPIFVPTFVPPGLAPEPPTGGELPGEGVTIKYHTAAGAVALTLINGTLDCCAGLDRMESMVATEQVKLSNGLSAKLANMGPRAGGFYLWFAQEGRLLSLNSSVLTKEQLMQVAASMSKTADLGKAEPAPARPTATPSVPKYAVLHPTWLPETMTVREEYDGDITLLGFDPRPNDAPHGVLTLHEMPKAMISRGGIPDPQETNTQMGGHAVTIVKRGQDCITLTWEMGDLQLTLTNPYDPPGHPRYSCDQLQKVLESVR